MYLMRNNVLRSQEATAVLTLFIVSDTFNQYFGSFGAHLIVRLLVVNIN